MALAKKKGVLTDYYKTREDVIDFYHDLSRKLARMRNKGVAFMDEEEYKILYAIHTGTLHMPDIRVGLMTPDGYPKTDNFRRGVFNPHVIFGISSTNVPYTDHQDPFLPVSGQANLWGDTPENEELNLFQRYNNPNFPMAMQKV